MMSGTNMLVEQLKSTANLLVLLFAAWLVLVKHPEGGPGPLTVGLLVTFRMYLNTAIEFQRAEARQLSTSPANRDGIGTNHMV